MLKTLWTGLLLSTALVTLSATLFLLFCFPLSLSRRGISTRHLLGWCKGIGRRCTLLPGGSRQVSSRNSCEVLPANGNIVHPLVILSTFLRLILRPLSNRLRSQFTTQKKGEVYA